MFIIIFFSETFKAASFKSMSSKCIIVLVNNCLKKILIYIKIRVLIGNLAPPVLKAAIAVFLVTPHSSKSTHPPATFEAQKSTDPFPFPIRTSVGLDVIGRSGKMRIHSFPFLFIFLEIACLAASICLADIVPDSAAFKPIFPNFSLFALNSKFGKIPFLTFLYFDLLGCKNINKFFRKSIL